MSEWRTYRIADLGRIVTGKTPPSSQPELFEGDIPFITPSDMAYDHRNISTERFVSTDWDSKKRTLLPARAVCVVCIGATIGKICMTSKPSQTNQQVNSVIVDPDRFDQGFVYYGLRTKADELVARAAGAATPIINKTAFSEVEIDAPSLPTQRRIASILGTYDDLIEVNRRRIAGLEEMARGLFEEWFVRFRFPGHEAASIEDTPDGLSPQGWAFDTLGKVAAINAASLKPTAAPAEIGYIDIASVSPGQINAINHMPFSEAPGRARRLVKDGSILWSNVRPNRRSFALVLDPAPEIVASTGFTVLDAKETSFTYLYHWVTTENFTGYLVGNAQGAAYPAVTAATFERAIVLLPPSDLVGRFTDFAEPMLRLCDDLRKSNVCLAASRDLLLPRLISGQLSVAQAERELEAA
ncbi:restriction endonuclease subunit S [Devosia faecipullorum]|uniref:restriction endonuclease subunit S n=1 Tax=Devosia faecipullorum TaxID=2755039 RepID=UPI00187BA0BB|nr:restriction endonuclease subunit S [Devosia faecipullorum]